MKELNENELRTIDAGSLWFIPALILGGLMLELITEGFEKCASDFKQGFESTQQ